MTEALELSTFELDQRRAKAYAESGYWPDSKSLAQALVKIEAGRTLGLAPIIAMNEIHVIDGKPTLGAGALSMLVKSSGRYDYRVIHLTNETCTIRFFERGETIGHSTFTMKDAETAKIKGRGPWQQYPRNMLFARALSNGVAWHCPDVTGGRFYTPEEISPDDYDEVTGERYADFEPPPASAIDQEPEPDDSYWPEIEPATPDQIEQIETLQTTLAEIDPGRDWKRWKWAETGDMPRGNEQLSAERAQRMIGLLESELARVNEAA